MNVGRGPQKELEEYFHLGHLERDDRQVRNLLYRYKDIFRTDKTTLTSKMKHSIIVEVVSPIAKAPYRLPHSERKLLRHQINEMLDDKIIEHSTSPWSSPVIMAVKKTEAGEPQYRLCIDYRGLNAVTIRDYFPLPRIQDVLEQLGHGKLFSTLDLATGYWQIKVDEKARPYTTFSTPERHFQCLRMPFGMANNPSSWCLLMSLTMAGLTSDMCLIYLDDIFVFRTTVEEYLMRLTCIFVRRLNAKLKFKPSKYK